MPRTARLKTARLRTARLNIQYPMPASGPITRSGDMITVDLD
jgi:hypothetical protein